MEFPEDISALSVDELNKLRTEASKSLDAFSALEAPSVEQVTEAASGDEFIEKLDAELTARQATIDQAASLRDKQAARSAAAVAAAAEPIVEPIVEPAVEPVVEPEAVVEPIVEPVADLNEPAAVAAAAATSTFNRAGANGARPDQPAALHTPTSRTITAAADVPNLAHGTKFNYLEDMAVALAERFEGYVPPSGSGVGHDWRNQAFARIQKHIPADHFVPANASDEKFWEVVAAVTDTSALPGGNLVAAGGWCSPSETAYDLCEGESLDGIMSLPEMGLGRGGLKYTMGPDWVDIFGNGYGVQTEAQAIAGTAKVPFEIPCTTFVETRLDALYQFVKVPILTEAAYPELVKRWMRGLVVSYAHKKNARHIALVEAALGAALVVNDYGSTAASLANGILLVVDTQRTIRRWKMTQAVELKLPFWVKGAVKADLGLRTGRPTSAVSDAEINGIFASAHVAVEWLYDWAGQDLVEGAVAYPATFKGLLYKAGTFVAGTNDVIKLDTVYDAASLAGNIYTALFMEEGDAVMRMCPGGKLITFASCVSGKTGAATIDECP